MMEKYMQERREYHMKEKLGVIARINENISKAKTSKRMKNTQKKLFLLEELFTQRSLTTILYLLKMYFIICSRCWLI